MGTYRNISLTFWTDAKIDDDFTPHEKYLYLYFLTNPHTNICGCYQIAQNQMTRETGLEWPEVEQLITRMQEVHKVLRYCPETKELLLLNWGKYNWSRSFKVQAAVEAVAGHIKHPEFRDYVLSSMTAKMAESSGTDQDLGGKKESTKEKTGISKSVSSKQNAVSRQHITEQKSDTDGPIGYRYPMDRVSDGDSLRDVEADFQRFWEAYPRKIREADARAAFQDVTVPVDVLIKAIEAQKTGKEWANEDGRYIPSPAKWLKGERWTDGVTPAEKKSEAKPRRKGALPF